MIMRRIAVWTCITLLSIASGRLMAAEVANPVLNPGFEEEVPNQSGVPGGWKVGAVAHIRLDGTVSHAGQKSLKVEITKESAPYGKGPRQYESLISSLFSLKPNTKYRLSVWVKIPKSTDMGGVMSLYYYGEKHEELLIGPGGERRWMVVASKPGETCDWKELVVAGKSPEKTAYGRVVLTTYGYGEGLTYYDDVKIEETD